MKIRYRRSGGLANIAREIEVDSQKLAPSLQAYLRTLRIMEATEPRQSDDFFHELFLEDGRIIRCAESRCEPELLELLQALEELA